MDGTIVRCAWCDSLAEVTRPLTPCPSCGHSLGVTKPACRCHLCVVQPARNQSKPDRKPADVIADDPARGWLLELQFAAGFISTLSHCLVCHSNHCPHVRAARASAEHLGPLLKLCEDALPKPAGGATIPF